MSRHNYGSRKGFSIDSALLEKKLLFDYAKRREESNVYLMSDLEACYDRQLPNIRGIVAESVGVNRNMMNILSKVLPKCDHYVGAAHGISTLCYGGEMTT